MTPHTVIKPEDIDTSKPFGDAFGRVEAETSAAWIVAFCQDRGKGWESFTFPELEAFYNEKGRRNFQFNGLLALGYIRESEGIYSITAKFIAKCYGASPREEEK
jgi:hypothetical protein